MASQHCLTIRCLAGVWSSMSDDGASKPVQKIDDATYGTPPHDPARRQLLKVKRWVLLDANRNTVAGLLLGASFTVIVLVGSFGPVPVQTFLTEGISPGTALVELLKSIVSVVVIVLSINQLVLSPGLGSVGDQRERFDQSIELRQQVEDHTGMNVSPVSPATFLSVLLDAIIDQTNHIDELTSRTDDQAVRERTNEFTNAVVGEARIVSTLLSSSHFGWFDVVSAVLRFAISEKVQSLRGIQQANDESLSEPVSEAFDEMNELLELFTVAREYLKTIYIREEFIRLSGALLYTGLPAILVTYCTAQIYTSSVFPGQIFGIEKQLLFVSGAVTIALAPFVLLISYGFRLASLSRSTLFIGPFDAREPGEDREETSSHGR